MKCQKCENGIVLVPVDQEDYIEGTTTRKMVPDLCMCCGGDYRDCEQCDWENSKDFIEGYEDE